MSNKKYENKKLKKYFEQYVKKLSVESKYKPMIVDVLLRRADTYDLSPEEIRQDVESLLYNLEEISVQEMPKEYENAYGLYIPNEKKVLIAEKIIGVKSDEQIYQTITHEIYHALSRDKNGVDRLAGYNSITGQYNSSLLEAIIEKSSYRAVFGNDRQDNIYYNNSANGYGDITFIVDLLEATYGVSEKEFLKNGIMGREKLAAFLAERSGETPDSAYMFLDSIETNYSLLHSSLYPFDGQKLSPYQKSLNIENALTGIYNLCENKMAERIGMTKVKSFEDIDNFNDELRYDHNKLSIIMNERLNHFSQYYDHSIRNNVYSRVNNSRVTTLTKINDINNLVEAVPNFSDEPNFLNAYAWAASGRLSELPAQTKAHYRIQPKFEYMLPMTQEIVDRAFMDETLGPQYNNSKISKFFNKFKRNDNSILKSGIDKIKDLFFKRDQKLLESGESQITPQTEQEEMTTIFPQLTKEQQEQYNKQVMQAVNNMNKPKRQEMSDKNMEDEER